MSEEFEKKLQQKIAEIRPADRDSMEAAKAHWRTVGKPLNSLGKLEEAVVRMAGIRGKCGLYDSEKRSCYHVCRQWCSR